MKKKQKQGNKNKKKKLLIIAAFMLFLLIISSITTVTVLHFVNENKNENSVLYYNEERKQEENNVLVVDLGNEPKENEANEPEEDKKQEDETKKNETKKNVSDKPYYIKVNYKANVVTIYKKDDAGNYTVPVKAMICSCGEATPTSGVYGISDKYTWRLLQGDVYGQYACRITGHILFHSVPYTKKDKSALEWWEYDKLGTSASLGCVRLTVKDVKWIYDNCEKGTQVEFYADSNPGPLGKPTAQKISDDTEVNGWDPTDPDKSNPWPDYLKKKEEAAAAETAKEAAKVKETSTKPAQNSTNNKTQETSTEPAENKVNANNNISTDTNSKNEV